jgi:hypothetical protein
MKNLHLIPTDKPSRLCKSKITQKLSMTDVLSFYGDGTYNQHIYITSDKEIKEDDWMIWNNRVVQAIDTTYYSAKKIILTTDQDLIKDGVQAIDDIFLEWFVENPSCEWVKTAEGKMKLNDDGQEYGFPDMSKYKIIIPKEEPKQETLEEAAKRTYQKGLKDDLSLSFHDGVKFGAKWQEERMYSEEDMKESFINGALTDLFNTWGISDKDMAKEKFDVWFEQFKKK